MIVNKEIYSLLEECSRQSGAPVEVIAEEAILAYLAILTLPDKDGELIATLIEKSTFIKSFIK